MSKQPIDLTIRYLGMGQTCSNCGRKRETTRYTVIHVKGNRPIQEFRVCDACQDAGFTIRFSAFSDVRDKLRARRIKVSQRMEKDLAEDVSGRIQPGSGNQDDKADVRVVGEWRLEHKYTDSASGYRLTVADLAAVVRHGNMVGEWPALVITFKQISRKFAVLPYELFLEMVERVRETTPRGIRTNKYR